MGQVRLDRESPVANNQPNGHARGAKRKMKMPHVITDSILNPGRQCGEGRNKNRIAA